MDIIEKAEPFLGQCGACDAGLPQSCTCPEGDYRPVMLELVREVERLRGNVLDQTQPRYTVKWGSHANRVGRRTKIDFRAHPFNRNARVFTLTFPEGDSANLWEWVCEKL